MERSLSLVLGLVALFVAAAAIVVGVVPVVRVERGLAIAPVPEGAVITEEVRRSGSDCGALVCTQRFRVYAVDLPGSEACAHVADRLEGDVTTLSIGELGVARCGWLVRDGDLLVGVIVEDAPTGTELVVSSRLEP